MYDEPAYCAAGQSKFIPDKPQVTEGDLPVIELERRLLVGIMSRLEGGAQAGNAARGRRMALPLHYGSGNAPLQFSS